MCWERYSAQMKRMPPQKLFYRKLPTLRLNKVHFFSLHAMIQSDFTKQSNCFCVDSFHHGCSKLILDKEELIPLQQAFTRTENMVRERDEVIASQTQVLEERWNAMQSMEAMVRERDEVIASQTQVLEKRWNTMQSIVNVLRTSLPMHRFNDVLNQLASTWKGTVPFLDLALSHYLFIARLHADALSKGAEDIFFFAREGQPLKEMFDFFQILKGEHKQIRTHYLKVSRRSTFLMSLGPLEEESFEVLTRQYRRISVLDFLKTLDLDEYTDEFAAEIGSTASEFAEVNDDLQSESRFQSLIELPLFRTIYETARIGRAAAFKSYLSNFLESKSIPNVLHVVDVGWKGSIQDNLYNWFRRERGEAAQIEGYYLGLVAPGTISDSNRKNGLLFSNLYGPTRGFYIFNENRSLYEIVLHADHGSAGLYKLDDEGKPSVIEDEFKEGKMIAEKICPVSAPIMAYFKKIAVAVHNTQIDDSDLFKLTVNKHARMVFRPTKEEIDWVFSISHLENFGVFEESSFGKLEKSGLFDRVKFSINVIRMRKPSHLGFWPWLSLKTRGLPSLSSSYALMRRLQSRFRTNKYEVKS